jgi:AhpD family alkylhydroperoxidase
MARIPLVDPATATGKAKEIFDGPLKGKHFNTFRGMANSPHVLDMYLKMNQALHGVSLSMKEVEVVELAASNVAGCDYCQAAHTAIGKGHGVPDDARMDALAKFTRAVVETRGNVRDEHLDAFRKAGFDDRAIVEVIGLIALANLTNTFNNVARPAIDFPAVEPV